MLHNWKRPEQDGDYSHSYLKLFGNCLVSTVLNRMVNLIGTEASVRPLGFLTYQNATSTLSSQTHCWSPSIEACWAGYIVL